MRLVVLEQLLCYAAHQRVVCNSAGTQENFVNSPTEAYRGLRTRIGVCEQGAYGEQDFANSQGRAPLILKDVQADLAVTIYVAVVYSCPKQDLLGGRNVFMTDFMTETSKKRVE